MHQTSDAVSRVVLALMPAPADHLPPVAATRVERGRAAFEAMAPNTRRAYASALAAWSRWADVHEVNGIEPAPADLRRYLQERAADGIGISTQNIFVAALRKLQGVLEVTPTARDQLVADTLAALSRKSRPSRQVAALTVGPLIAIYESACFPRVGRSGARESVDAALRRGLVDIALCRVISDAGLRRSEAAALVWEDVQRWEDGSGRLTVRRSKTDADPRTVYLTPIAMCDLDAIRPEDPLGSDSVFGLSAASISRRIKAAARAAGLGAGYSGHSGRVGMARRMAAAGAPTHEIMAQGRWKTPGMVTSYTRSENAGRAAKWLQ